MHNKKLLDELASRLSSALPFAREVSGELRTKIEQQLFRVDLYAGVEACTAVSCR